MGYTDFSLFWTEFGGYADDDKPFDVPATVCIFAKCDRAYCLNNWREPVSASDVHNLVAWLKVPTDIVGRELLHW